MLRGMTQQFYQETKFVLVFWEIWTEIEHVKNVMFGKNLLFGFKFKLLQNENKQTNKQTKTKHKNKKQKNRQIYK